MSERKVLNKYYPPEFDPSKIPKLKQPKNRTFSIRIMAPFNMRCDTCGEYIYKGKKFNSRKENVDNEDYLGLRIFRFYIKCPRCVAEIAFKTDLEHTDYALEAGAQRLFEAEKLAHQMAERERRVREEDELNPMKVLENRTKASRNEMEQLDQLEELREMNARHARVEHESMLKKHMEYEQHLVKLQAQHEDRLVQEILKQGTSGTTVKRIKDDDSDEEKSAEAKKVRLEMVTSTNATDILADKSTGATPKKKESWERSVGSFATKPLLTGLVKKKSADSKQQSSDEIKKEHGDSSVSGKTESSASIQQSGSQGTELDVKPDVKPVISTGLGMLGDYSNSSEGDSE